MAITANYDRTAWFYDALARLVYGKGIKKSQTWFLPHIPTGARVLIAGGGTGWILEEIARIHPAGLSIFYAEVSENMIRKAEKRNYSGNILTFIHKPVEEVVVEKIDVVITPFLFDNYDTGHAVSLFQHMDSILIANGLWLNAGFEPDGNWWQNAMLKTMLLFFKLFGAVSNSKTTDMQPIFETTGYKKIAGKTFYGDFIRSDVWQKSG